MDELWGLAVHPTDAHFLTGGYDKQLVLWDASSHSPIWSQVGFGNFVVNLVANTVNNI